MLYYPFDITGMANPNNDIPDIVANCCALAPVANGTVFKIVATTTAIADVTLGVTVGTTNSSNRYKIPVRASQVVALRACPKTLC